jgi:aspartate aminotransferase
MLKRISRAEITSAPAFGARIVAAVLHDPVLEAQWRRDLRTMSGRLGEMRKRLWEGLVRWETPGGWGHVLSDVSVPSVFVFLWCFGIWVEGTRLGGCELTVKIKIGMFSMTGLSPEQVAVLRDRFHVYLLPNGRLSVTGCKWPRTPLGVDSTLQLTDWTISDGGKC